MGGGGLRELDIELGRTGMLIEFWRRGLLENENSEEKYAGLQDNIRTDLKDVSCEVGKY